MKIDPTLQIILTILIALGTAIFAYFLVIHFVVDTTSRQISNDFSRGENLLHFYEQNHDGDIFIVGSSSVNEGIDANIIDEYLQKNHINRSVYILGTDSDTPLQRVFEVENIIYSKPKMVVVGLSYRDLTNNTDTSNIDKERLLLFMQGNHISEKKHIREEFLPYFNDEQLTQASQTSVDGFFDKRKLFMARVSGFVQRLFFNSDNKSDRMYLFTANFKDPWTRAINRTDAEKIEIVKSLSDNYSHNVSPVFEDQNPQKKAFTYTIDRLQQENISIIIINMPINPLLSEVTNESTRKNFSDFLNSTGVSWYDYEREYPSEYFMDSGHMNIAGRTDFSPKLAKILAENFIKGV